MLHGVQFTYIVVENDDINLFLHAEIIQGNLLLTMKRAEAAVSAFRAAQELRPDIRSYQGLIYA